MSEKIQRKTICAVCEKEIKLDSSILLNGCPYCGSFKFKTFKEGDIKNKDVKELELIVEKEIEQTDIQKGLEAIRLTSNGVFEVDIDKLLNEQDDSQPIISRNKDGSYYIKFQNKNEEN